MNIVIGFVFVISTVFQSDIPSEIGDIVNPERHSTNAKVVLAEYDTLSECQNVRLAFARHMTQYKLTGSYTLTCEAVSATSL